MKRLQFFVLLLLTVTMPALVPGQQYTGVKSVSSSPSEGTEGEAKSPEKAGGGTTSGISARSIDKFEANELPDGDSKIIKLAIKQVEPQVTSGSRGARNLGFAADASLNAIPGGLNNELTNGDFKVPVTPPSTVAKDSYGNPVTPYTDLGTTGLDSIGFVPEAHRDALQGSNSNQYGHLNFKLPSYASGIIEPVLLPPIAPVNFQPLPDRSQYGPQPTTTTKPPTTPFQFVPNAKIPTLDDGQILFAQKPLNGLIPPLFPGEQKPEFKLEVGTERSPIFVKDPFVSPSLDKGLTLPHDQPSVNFNQGSSHNSQVPLQVPLSLAPLPQQPQTPQYHQTPQQTQFKPTQAPVQKFTGSFGGAPGLLGNQQNLGTAYKSTPRPAQPNPPQTYPTPPPTHFLPTVQQSSNPTQAPNKFTGSFGGAPGFLGSQQNLGTAYTSTPRPAQPIGPQTTHFSPAVPQQTTPTQAPNKFTGSFGGAPGFLGSQQNLGTAYTSTPRSAQPIGPQTPQVTQTTHFTHSVPQYTNPTQAPNKFTGSFGGAPGFLGSQQNLGTAYTSTPRPAQPIAPQSPQVTQTTHFSPPIPHHTNPTQAPNKFTGSFGGAPGFLGNQQTQGTAYKPTTPIPSQTPQRPVSFQPPPPPPQQPQQPLYPQNQVPNIIRPPSPFQPQQRPGQYVGSTFTGSFGGAPGLLGNQQKPGTHVKPDGTILPPSGPGVSGPSSTNVVGGGAAVHRPSVPASGSTFNGSFGGPPGVLRPFDNVKG